MRPEKKRLIAEHLKRGESITGLQALALYDAYRLSSTINRLRNEGLKIETTMIQRDDSTSFAKYWIPINERRK
ncbi:MAG TPA: helix-turn-helix domain-containing protein [Ignavibacteriaceae bacterium]